MVSAMARRQKVLILYLADSSLESAVVAWARYDGTGELAAVTSATVRAAINDAGYEVVSYRDIAEGTELGRLQHEAQQA